MKLHAPSSIRARLTSWYVSVLGILLLVYAVIIFIFQYATLTSQIFHDEVQDVITAEGLLYFDDRGNLQLRQDYYSRPQSHLLIDRMMEVRDLSGSVLYRSSTLHGYPLGGPNRLNEGDSSFNERIVKLDDGRHVFVVSHIHSMNGRTLLIRLGYSLVPLRDRMRDFFFMLLIAIPVTLGLAALMGQRIAKRALRPLEEMTQSAEGITVRNLSDRLEIVNPEDELGHMAKVFNHLLQRLEESFQQLQRFTADAAHELRTPLASIRAVGEVTLEKDESSGHYREALSSMLEETGKLSETIDSLLLLARTEAVSGNERLESFSIGPLFDEVLGLLGILIEERNIEVVQLGSELAGLKIAADRTLFRVAIMNVLHNALKFSPQDSVLRIQYKLPESEVNRLHIAIQDEGPGIALENHEKVFERFFRGTHQPDTQKAGTGLGLPISRLIVHRSGGNIYFDRASLWGAHCIIEMPYIGS